MQIVEPAFGNLGVDAVKGAFRAAAMLDVLIEADAPYRYYKHRWADQTDLAEVDDGCGNNMFAIFVASENGLIKGFDHESALSPYPDDKAEVWPGIFDEVPDVFRPALSNLTPGETLPLDTTFCIWRTAKDEKWMRGLISFPDLVTMEASAILRASSRLTPAHMWSGPQVTTNGKSRRTV